MPHQNKSQKCYLDLGINLEWLKLEYWVRIEYPTGQNHSLELMFAKFATAKNSEKFKPSSKW